MPDNPHPPQPGPQLSPERNEYPTDEQMDTIFNAWRKDGKEGIARALRELYPRTHQKQ
jgi:hypothetical protein